MMRLIIGSSLRFRYLVLALGVVLTWFGLVRLRDVPVDVFPEFAPPRVEIQTICLGLSSAEVEQLALGMGGESGSDNCACLISARASSIRAMAKNHHA